MVAQKKKKENEKAVHSGDGSTVEEISKNFGLTVREVIKELKTLNIKKRVKADIIEEEHVLAVLEHFEKYTSEKEKAAVKPEANKEVQLKAPVTVKQLAEALGKKPPEIVKLLMMKNILASINQTVDMKVVKEICDGLGVTVVAEKKEKKQPKKEIEAKPKPEKKKKPEVLKDRPPVVTFLGHVDHGKTSIQDAIRKTTVVKGEAGGITQHTGASVVNHGGKEIVFIDTPGHEAFTQMRARGANVTDIAVLVVAADDGFMPQTVEAMNHAKAAGVPIIVAINKIDLPAADPDKVLLHMQQNNLMSEDWGGEVGTVRVSAMTGDGLDDLLDRILLESEMLELKANPLKPAECIVLEAELETGMGATANVLVRDGSISMGNPILCGSFFGKVKALIDFKGKRVKKVGPSMPVKVLGLSGVPKAGAILSVCSNEKEAAEVAAKRRAEERTENLTRSQASSLEDLFSTMEENKKRNLLLSLKLMCRVLQKL